MLPATTDLPESPTPLLPDQPQDSLTAVVSGTAGTWHPGHALYCFWRPRRRTRPWCTKSSVPSAAALCAAWETLQGPEPQPATEPAAARSSRTRAARAPHRPCARGETARRTRVCLLPQEDRTMNVTPQAAESATNHDDPGRADLAQKNPLVQPNNARPRNTHQQRPSTGHTSGEGVNLPGTCNGRPRGRG